MCVDVGGRVPCAANPEAPSRSSDPGLVAVTGEILAARRSRRIRTCSTNSVILNCSPSAPLRSRRSMLGSAAEVEARHLEGVRGEADRRRAKETAAIWRTDPATGRTYALKLTAKGEIAVAKSEGEAAAGAKSAAKRLDAARAPRAGKRPIESSQAAPGADANCDDASSSDDRSEPRANSKLALIVDLLSRDRGATIEELMAATGWLPHTTRAALTRLGKRGFGLERFKGERGGASVCRLAADRRRAQGAARTPIDVAARKGALSDVERRAGSGDVRGRGHAGKSGERASSEAAEHEFFF